MTKGVVAAVSAVLILAVGATAAEAARKPSMSERRAILKAIQKATGGSKGNCRKAVVRVSTIRKSYAATARFTPSPSGCQGTVDFAQRIAACARPNATGPA